MLIFGINAIQAKAKSCYLTGTNVGAPGEGMHSGYETCFSPGSWISRVGAVIRTADISFELGKAALLGDPCFLCHLSHFLFLFRFFPSCLRDLYFRSFLYPKVLLSLLSFLLPLFKASPSPGSPSASGLSLRLQPLFPEAQALDLIYNLVCLSVVSATLIFRALRIFPCKFAVRTLGPRIALPLVLSTSRFSLSSFSAFSLSSNSFSSPFPVFPNGLIFGSSFNLSLSIYGFESQHETFTPVCGIDSPTVWRNQVCYFITVSSEVGVLPCSLRTCDEVILIENS